MKIEIDKSLKRLSEIVNVKDKIKHAKSNPYERKPSVTTVLTYVNNYLKDENINLATLTITDGEDLILNVISNLLEIYTNIGLKNIDRNTKNDYVLFIDKAKAKLLDSMSNTNDAFYLSNKMNLEANYNLRNTRLNGALSDIYPGLAARIYDHGSDAIAFKTNAQGQILDVKTNAPVPANLIEASINNFFDPTNDTLPKLEAYIKNGEQKTHITTNFTLDTILSLSAEISDIAPKLQIQQGLTNKDDYDMIAFGLYRKYSEKYYMVFTTNDLNVLIKFKAIISKLRELENLKQTFTTKYKFLTNSLKTRRTIVVPLWMFCSTNDNFYVKRLNFQWFTNENNLIVPLPLMNILTQHYKVPKDILLKRVKNKLGAYCYTLSKPVRELKHKIDDIRSTKTINAQPVNLAKLPSKTEVSNFINQWESGIRDLCALILADSLLFNLKLINKLVKGVWVTGTKKQLKEIIKPSKKSKKQTEDKGFYRSDDERNLLNVWKQLNNLSKKTKTNKKPKNKL